MSEVERRFADQSPAWLIPRLAWIQNMRQLWAEQAVKRKQDHRMGMRAAGFEDIVDKDDEPDVPGDINIKGDEYHTESGGATNVPASWLVLGPLLAMLFGGLLPLCGIALAQWWNRPTPPAAQAPAGPTQDFKLGIQVHD